MGKVSYVQGYAVIGVDNARPLNPPSQFRLSDGTAITDPGPSNVTVKEIVMSADEARREVDRLNALNSEKGCAYYWQSTHIFLNGGSHGSTGNPPHENATNT
jgi:hypothetical protein